MSDALWIATSLAGSSEAPSHSSLASRLLAAALLSLLALPPGALCWGGVARAEDGPAKKASDLVRDRLREHVVALTSSEAEGRGPGRAGLDSAADHIVQGFSTAGLTPAGDGGSWFQSFTPAQSSITDPGIVLPEGKRWGEITLRNVIGILPGEAGADARCVVIGAHYDHLGVAADGQRFPGADDNASGVAILLELASQLRLEGPYRCTIVLAAFSGEEEGTLGSRHYVEHAACPLPNTIAMINLDTVGRMEGEKLYIFGSGSAAELPGTLKNIAMGTTLELITPESGPFASDQIPFFEKGIPVLHFFSGPNPDYHRVTDTEDQINYDGMLACLDFVKETAVFLADREGKLTFVPPGAAKAAPAMAGAGGAPRRVSLGTIPDFSRESGGVLLEGTMPGSPAEKAGFVEGDIVISIGGTPIDNLADFSAALKRHQPGDSVDVVVRRGKEEIRRRLALVERK